MKLTDNLCRSTKPTARYQDFSDPGTPLTFRVKANGERIFLWRGRVGGKQTMRVIGSYPTMTLADARLEAAKMKKDAKANVASIAPVIHPQHRPKFTTLQEAAERFEKVRLVHNVSGDQVMAMFNARLLSKLGKRDIRSLTRIELNQHFNDHLEAGFNGPAINRYLAHVKALLNWAVREDLIEFNPAATIDKKVKEKPRTRIITDWELAAILHALPSCGPYAAPLKLLLMTCTRRSDILGLQWGEVVTLDDGTMELNIAPWRTKTEVRHIVPLSKEARALLPERPEDASDKDRVFADASICPGGPLLPKVRVLTERHAGKEVDHFTLHDFRTACTTWISDQIGRGKHRFTDRAKDMLLAHVPKGTTGRHYDHSACLDERTEMLAIWADHIEASAKKYPSKAKKYNESA